MKKFIVTILISIGIYLTTSIPTYALVNLHLDNNENMYTIDITKKTEKKLKFILENTKNSKTEVQVYPSDQLTGVGGGPDYNLPGQEPELYGKWLNQKKYNLTLGPKEKKEIWYTLSVPDDLKDGQYIAVIVAREKLSPQNKISGEGGETLTTNIDRGLALGRQIVINKNIKNSQRSLEVDSLDFKYSTKGAGSFTVNLKNTGTILLKSAVTVKIKDKSGRMYPSISHQNDLSFYGGTKQTIVLPYTSFLDKGEYTAIIEASFGGKKVNKTFSFSVTAEEAKDVKNTTSQESNIIVEKEIPLYVWVLIGLLSINTITFILFFLRRKRKEERFEKN